MIAVVTGGSGFVGQNLVRLLVSHGHDVRCLVRPEGGSPPPGASRHVVRYDEPATLLNCRALDDADVVFHLAATTVGVRASDFAAGNVTPVRALLGAIAARRLRPRFVLVSSLAAAGPAPSLNRPLTEVDTPHPVEDYGRSKLEAERIAESFSDRVPVTIVRPSAVFGPYDRDFLRLFRMAERGLIVFPGNAAHWLSLVHVSDLAASLVSAATDPIAISRTYFVAAAEPMQWRALGASIATLVGKRVRQVDPPGVLVRGAALAGDVLARLTRRATLANRNKATLARQRFWICDPARAQAELGFRESRSLPEALRDTYYWYRDNGWTRRARHAVTTAQG